MLMFKKVSFSLTLLAGAVLMSQVAFTESKDKPDYRNLKSMVNIFGATLTYLPPVWYKSNKNPLENSEFHRVSKGGLFMLEEIPKGQSFDDWKEIYVVMATGGVTESVKQDLDLYFSDYKIACNKHYDMSVAYQGDDKVIFQVMCEKTPGTTASGYGKKKGTLALFSYTRLGNIAVFNKHEWRGKAFKKSDKESWPVSQRDYAETLMRLQQVKFMPPQKDKS